MDEPTNYLDNDTLAALTKALKDFQGGVLTISHNQAFINELCNETWTVGDGMVVAKAIEGKEKKMSVAERRALKKGGEDAAADVALKGEGEQEADEQGEEGAERGGAEGERSHQGCLLQGHLTAPRPPFIRRRSQNAFLANEVNTGRERSGFSSKKYCASQSIPKIVNHELIAIYP